MKTPLRRRSGGHIGTAPTIPNTHRRSAKMKTKILMLAVTLQALKSKITTIKEQFFFIIILR